jgi:hypothetical protein
MLKLGGVGWPGAVRRGGGAAELGWHRGNGMELTGGAHVSAKEERDDESSERHNSAEKAYSKEFSKRLLGGLGRVRGNVLWGKAGQRGNNWAGWAGS